MKKTKMNTADRSRIHARLFPQKIGKGDQTKLRIIEACIRVMAKTGIESVTFDSVAKDVHMKAPQIKYHFPQKENLIFKSIEYVMFTPQEFFVKEIEKSKTWETQISGLIDGIFDWADAHPEQGPVYLQFFQLSTFHRVYRDIHSKMFQTGGGRVQAILKQIQEKRKWSDEKVEWIGHTVWSIIDGFMLYRLGVDGMAKNYFRNYAHRSVKHFLNSV